LLHNIPPANAKGLRFQPHVWQAKGAAQGHYLCEAKYFKGFFCGDEMGLGKTLLAVLMMKLAQPMRGICIVVAPKTVCSQWLDEINCAFVEVCFL
jgi:SNF2 family DNA or RNA helicase